ncbi:MAG: hypothetical protein FD164_126 [Nitrospirae bacterium]|nr:MAG: hypothetical protein FD164_126 [Nitrospirota bacterium]
MIGKIKRDYDTGLEKTHRVAQLFAEREQVELSVFNLPCRAGEVKRPKNELLRQVGEEVYAVRGKDKQGFANKDVAAALREIEQLEPEIQATIRKTSGNSKIVA